MRDFYRTARSHAYCAMSSTAQRMTDVARPRTYRTPPGSPEHAALHDLRTRMDDLRIAFNIAAKRGDLSSIDRNGFNAR